MRSWVIWINVLVTLFLVLFLDIDFTYPSPLAVQGESPRFYAIAAQDALEDTIITSIKGAKHSIVLIIYSLKDWKVIKALNQKAKDGIDVTVIYDKKASFGVEKYLSPTIHSFARVSKGLMHLKLLVIDEESTWIGSANFTHDGLKKDANLMVNLHAPEFAQVILKKADQLSDVAYEKPIATQSFVINDQVLEMHFLPDDKEAIHRIKELIRSAKKTIKVAMYTFTREDLADTLIQAQKRGVDVKVVLDPNAAKGAGKKIVKKIPTYIYGAEGLMHHKFLVIDDEILVHGSANWTQAAFKQNDDCFMIINKLNDSQKKVMDDIWSKLIKSKI